jgi:N-acetyl-anhydromuramyl-L-alanine amidase AmpD
VSNQSETPSAVRPLARQNRLALWLASAALVALCSWVAWQWWRGPDRSHEPVTWDKLAPAPAVAMRPWRAIVVHHSGSRRDTTASIDRWHRKRGWDGIGYHFVIGNGREMPAGQIDPTFRWWQQREGAHAGSSPQSKPLNETGIGICLIGNFNEDQPEDYQTERLVELCATLIRHLPGLTPASIIGHRDVPGKDTDCPGKLFDVERIRYLVRQRLDELGPLPASTPVASPTR